VPRAGDAERAVPDARRRLQPFGLDRLGHHLRDAMLWWKERTMRPLTCVQAPEFATAAQKVAAAARHRGGLFQ
jgi:hypothetical protein